MINRDQIWKERVKLLRKYRKQNWTLEELGLLFKLTRERVRQILLIK